MSGKPIYEDGISVDADHGGLLCIEEERLIHIIKKEPISNVYHVEQTPFARGKFAAVRKCTHQQTGREYAAKFIRKRRRAMDQRRDIIHEVAVLRLAADNRRIVRLHEVYETSAEMALVLELASGGELQRVLDVQDGLEEVKAVQLMHQILEGLCFLHDRNIAHLDLKPQNLLLTGEYPDCDVKLCDFGISRVIQTGIEVREILGTPDYVAPEILSYEPITLATDIWSVGVLAYVLLSGFSPFGGDTKQETFLNISQCSLTFPDELFSEVSPAAQAFVRATLQTEPKKRLTARQCLAHPWLAGARGGGGAEEGGKLDGVVVQMSQDYIVEADAEKVMVVEMAQDLEQCDVGSGRVESAPAPPGEMPLSSEQDQNVDAVVGCCTTFEVNSMVVRIAQESEQSQNINANVEICTNFEERSVVVGMSQDADLNEGFSTFNGSIESRVYEEGGSKVLGMSQDVEYNEVIEKVNSKLKCCSDSEGPVQHLECCKGYKERRTVVEMSQDRGESLNGGRNPESDEDLPVQKRPKNCCDGCCLSYPVAQCCNLHVSPEAALNGSVATSAADRTVLC